MKKWRQKKKAFDEMPQDFESYVEAKEYGDEMFGEGDYTIESPC